MLAADSASGATAKQALHHTTGYCGCHCHFCCFFEYGINKLKTDLLLPPDSVRIAGVRVTTIFVLMKI
jgi:hypothetical protein